MCVQLTVMYPVHNNTVRLPEAKWSLMLFLSTAADTKGAQNSGEHRYRGLPL